jgi:hypothetical protein
LLFGLAVDSYTVIMKRGIINLKREGLIFKKLEIPKNSQKFPKRKI